MNLPDRPQEPRRQPKRLLIEAAFVVLTLVLVFVGFVYWYFWMEARYRNAN